MRRRLPVLLCCLALVLAAVAAAQQPLPVLHWGFRGQVGAAYLGSNVPLHVSMPNAIAVAGGFYSSAAIAADGHVWTWGTNSSGQLGDGTNTDRADPVAVVNLDRVVAIAAGSFHVLALRDDHTVWAWGLNQSGQLGNGTRTNANVPVAVTGLSNVVAVAAGNQHSLALTADGRLFAWGLDQHGQLGLGSPNGVHLTPEPLPGPSNVSAVEAFADVSMAVLGDGSVWSWGANSLGQLGDGTQVDRASPVPIGVTNAVGVAPGGDGSAALLADGTVATWGSNNHLILGDGTAVSRFTPAVIPNLVNVRRVDAGFGHMVALKHDGTVWVWGSNTDWGQLGLGLPIWYGTNVPVQVTAVSRVGAVSAGGASVVALGYLAGEDTAPPTISCEAPPAGWQGGNVSIACTASDDGSGLASEADASFTLTTSVAAGEETASAATGTRQVCDNAGSCATAGPIGGIKVDRRPPTIALTAPSGTFLVNQPAPASYSCADGGSGVATCAGPVASGASAATASPGARSFTVSATDAAGNTASGTIDYTVAYGICPLYDAAKAVKSGATIPIKLRLCDASGANLSSAGIVVHVQSLTQVSSDASLEVQDAGNANPDYDFRFSSDLYIFNLKTTGLTTGSYVLTLTAGGDPTTHGASFQVR